jgi:5-methylcytosine-specific restriction endonuclease McrA
MARDWTAARLKVDARRCRVCRSNVKLDAAHIVPRSRVSAGARGEHPDNIVPLCHVCHRAYDGHRLDILPC